MLNNIQGNEKSIKIITTRNSFGLPFLFLLMFFLIFRIFFPGVSTQITSTKVCSVILFIVVIIQSPRIILNKYGVSGNFLSLLVAFFLYFLFSEVLSLAYGAGNGITLSGYFLSFLIYCSIAYYSICRLFRNTDQLMNMLLCITVVQAVIIIVASLSSGFRGVINPIFNSQSYLGSIRDIDTMFGRGYSYGIGCAASTGSLAMAYGVFASVYYLIKPGTAKLKYWIILALLTIASTMLSRTGLFISIGALAVILVVNLEPKKLFKVIISLAVVFAIVWLLFQYSPWAEDLLSRFSRLEYLINYGFYESYVKYYDTTVPPLSSNLFIGTGIVSGTNGIGVNVSADGGYLRMYAAIGLIPTVVYYIIILVLLFKTIMTFQRKQDKVMLLFIAAIIIFGEIKEPHILASNMLWMYFVIAHFMERQQRNEAI